jgi:pilus assembly protein FimV
MSEEPELESVQEDAGEDQGQEPFISEMADEEFEAQDFADDEDATVVQAIGAESQGAEAQAEGETGDVIGEAEIYIAYGRYGQAANLLNGALANDPDRWDVRLKMLEVCVESHDEEGFSTHAQYVLDHCEDEEVLLACRDLEAQFDSSHVDLSADIDAADEDSGENAAADVVEAQDEEDDSGGLDFDLEGFGDEDETVETLAADLSPEVDEEAPAVTDDAQDDTSPDEGLDFELEFDAESAEESAEDSAQGSAEETAATDATDALGGDLGLDFDPDRDVEETFEDAGEDAEPLEDIEFDLSAEDAGDEQDEDLDDLLSELDTEDSAVEGSEAVGDADLDDMLLEFEDQPIADPAPETSTENADESADNGVAEPELSEEPLLSAVDPEADTQVNAEADAVTTAEADADDFEFAASGDGDINATKLDLAEAYVDMGDADGAQDILSEVLEEGTPEQQQKAQEILDRLAS